MLMFQDKFKTIKSSSRSNTTTYRNRGKQAWCMDIVFIFVPLSLHYFPLKGSCGVEEQLRETKTQPAAAAPQISLFHVFAPLCSTENWRLRSTTTAFLNQEPAETLVSLPLYCVDAELLLLFLTHVFI